MLFLEGGLKLPGNSPECLSTYAPFEKRIRVTRRCLQCFARLLNVCLVVFKGIIPNIEPSVAMCAYLMTISYACFGKVRVPFHRYGNRPQSHIPSELLHQTVYAPCTTTTTILKILLAVQVPVLLTAARWSLLPKILLARLVPVERIPFSALFIIKDKGNSNACTVWPLCIVTMLPKS
jgi:hypothetical protein